MILVHNFVGELIQGLAVVLYFIGSARSLVLIWILKACGSAVAAGYQKNATMAMVAEKLNL